MAVAFQVPVAIVPTEVNDEPVTPAARVAPVRPEAGTAVAVIVPVPVTPKDAPVPTSIAAAVLVPPVRELNADAAGAAQLGTPAEIVRTWPADPAPSLEYVPAPVPYSKSPLVV